MYAIWQLTYMYAIWQLTCMYAIWQLMYMYAIWQLMYMYAIWQLMYMYAIWQCQHFKSQHFIGLQTLFSNVCNSTVILFEQMCLQIRHLWCINPPITCMTIINISHCHATYSNFLHVNLPGKANKYKSNLQKKKSGIDSLDSTNNLPLTLSDEKLFFPNIWIRNSSFQCWAHVDCPVMLLNSLIT